MIRMMIILILSFVCFKANSDIPDHSFSKIDDSEKIIENIKRSLPQGMVSLEKRTGRLLFNPKIEAILEKKTKERFFIPAMLVDKNNGLKLVQESPFSCFTISAGELGEEEYSQYRQHSTLRYIQDAKKFSVKRVLICDVFNENSHNWKNQLDLVTTEKRPFTFEDHTSITGEHFFYYLDENGSFEIYM